MFSCATASRKHALMLLLYHSKWNMLYAMATLLLHLKSVLGIIHFVKM